jgi:hypothetical protein
MRFKIWLENMESAEDITKKFSDIILASPNYQMAIANLLKMGIKPNFDTNRYSGLGHKWSELFYGAIAGDKGSQGGDPDMDRALSNLNSQILALGFNGLDAIEPFYFFGIPGYKPDGAKSKIHIKIPSDKLNLALELAKFIKQNSSYVRQFKFSAFGNSFNSRRDNFIIYLSKSGEENLNQVRQSISQLGLPTDVGEDFKGKNGSSLSQTQLVSLRLAAMLVNRPNGPQPTSPSASHWQTTEKEFLLSDPVGSRYLKQEAPTSSSPTSGPASDNSQPYQPKTLVLSSAGRPLTINVDTKIGKYSLQQSLGDAAQYFSDMQFDLRKSNDGWYLSPNTTAINRTIINGAVVTKPTRIKINDQIGVVGKSGRQIVPLKITSV